MRLAACLFPSLFQSIKNEWGRQWRIRWRKNKKTERQHQQQKPTKFQLFEISPPLTPATASMKSHYCVYEACATSPSLSLSLSLTHNVVTLYKIQLCLNILFWLTENYIVLPVSLTVYQPCLYVYPLFQDLFSLPFFFHDRNVSNGWVILSGAGCLSGVLLYISMTRPSLPAARHSYEFQPHSHILQTRAKHRWVAAEERRRQRKRDGVRAEGGCLYCDTERALFPTTHTLISPTAPQIRIDNIYNILRGWHQNGRQSNL